VRVTEDGCAAYNITITTGDLKKKRITREGRLTRAEFEDFWRGLVEAGTWGVAQHSSPPVAMDHTGYGVEISADGQAETRHWLWVERGQIEMERYLFESSFLVRLVKPIDWRPTSRQSLFLSVFHNAANTQK